MKILRDQAIDPLKWDDLVATSAGASPFQSRGFYELVNKVNGLSAKTVAVSKNGDILALALITLFNERGLIGLLSSRAIIFGGVLVRDGEHKALEMLLHEVAGTISERAIYIETRNLSDYSDYKNIFAISGWRFVPHLNYHIQTADKQQMIQSMSASRYRQVKKAIKAGVHWSEAKSLDQVRSFYRILSHLYKTKVKKPLMPWEFFESVFKEGFGKILLIHYQDKILGGIVCLFLQKKALYEFYVCGLDLEYRDQYPSVMATWAAMEYANLNGYPVFDFMGAGSPHENYGVRQFKEKFGGKLVEYGRFKKILRPALYMIGKTGLAVKRKVF